MSASRLSSTYHGYIHSTRDALLVIQEVLDKQLESVTRRPHERERSLIIKSGAVFVFIEQQSGIKRWTDGISWSPSRIQGRFLVYGELDKRSLTDKDGKKKKKRKYGMEDEDVNDNMQLHPNKSIRLNSMILPSGNDHTSMGPHHSTIPVANIPSNVIPASSSYNGINDYRPNLLNGPLVSACILQDGLVKKTITISTTNKDVHFERREGKQTIHLISYYSKQDIDNGRLQRPSESDLKNVQIHPCLWTAAQDSSLGGKTPIEDEEYYGLDPSIQQTNTMNTMSMVAPTSGSNNGTKSYSNYSKNIARVYNNKYSNVVSGGPGDENNNSLEVPFINPFHQHSSSTNPYASQVYTNASVSPYNTYQQQTLSTTSSSPQQQINLVQQQSQQLQQQQQYGQYTQYTTIPPQVTTTTLTSGNGQQQQQQGPPPDLYSNQYATFPPPQTGSVYGPIYQYHLTPNNNATTNTTTSSSNDQYGVMTSSSGSAYHASSHTPNTGPTNSSSATNGGTPSSSSTNVTSNSTSVNNNKKFNTPSTGYSYGNNNNNNNNNNNSNTNHSTVRNSTGSNATTTSTSSISGPSGMTPVNGGNSWFANSGNGGYITSSSTNGTVHSGNSDYDNGNSSTSNGTTIGGGGGSSSGAHNLPSFSNGVSGLQPQGQVIPSLVTGNNSAAGVSSNHHHHQQQQQHPHSHHAYNVNGGTSVGTTGVTTGDESGGNTSTGPYYTTAS